MTPGRQRKDRQTQYFDVGKVGRRTGVTLPDKGIRDEHGLEPVSGIFSSPVSPQRNGDRTLTSSDMHVQDSMYTSGVMAKCDRKYCETDSIARVQVQHQKSTRL